MLDRLRWYPQAGRMVGRAYVHGAERALWRWTDVVLDARVYLTRLILVMHRQVGSVMLHWINFPDPQPDPHDHPVTFLSIVLRGGYTEWRSDPAGARRREGRTHRVRWWNFVWATDVHKILSVEPRTLTLIFGGPNRRRWGFHTEHGWVDWQDYRGWK